MLMKSSFVFLIITTPSFAKIAPVWDCTLHRPNTREVESFRVQLQENGWYGDGKWRYFKVIEDSETALIAANSGVGISIETNVTVVGAQILMIDKKTHLAKLSYDYLSGYEDRSFYGSCVSD